MQVQQTLLDRQLQSARQTQAFLQRRPHRRLIKPKTTAHRLGPIHGDVSMLDQIADAIAVVRVQRHANAARQMGRLIGYLHGCAQRSEEHTSELQSLMRISYAVFCLKKQNTEKTHEHEMINKTIMTTKPDYSNQHSKNPNTHMC